METKYVFVGRTIGQYDARQGHWAAHHTGNVGDITAGLPPQDYGATPYIEVYARRLITTRDEP